MEHLSAYPEVTKNVESAPKNDNVEIPLVSVTLSMETVHSFWSSFVELSTSEASIHITLKSADSSGLQLLVALVRIRIKKGLSTRITCDDHELSEVISAVGLKQVLQLEN